MRKTMIEPLEKPEGLSEFAVFKEFARKIVNVPKEAVDRLEAEEQEQAKKEKRRPPKKKAADK